MANISDTESKEFALVHRKMDDSDVITERLRVVITDVPASVEVHHLKSTVDAVGSDILEEIRGVDYDEQVDWSNGYKLAASERWNDALRAKVSELKEESQKTDEEIEDGVPRALDTELGRRVILGNDSCDLLCRIVTYADLWDHLTGEKRITLRLPRGLHSLLARNAYQSASSSLNSFCTRTLADAVGYEDLEEFEAQQRKPGRPRKTQDAE